MILAPVTIGSGWPWNYVGKPNFWIDEDVFCNTCFDNDHLRCMCVVPPKGTVYCDQCYRRSGFCLNLCTNNPGVVASRMTPGAEASDVKKR